MLYRAFRMAAGWAFVRSCLYDENDVLDVVLVSVGHVVQLLEARLMEIKLAEGLPLDDLLPFSIDRCEAG